MMTRSMDNSHHGTHVLAASVDTLAEATPPSWYFQISIDHGDAEPGATHTSAIISKQYETYDDCVIAMNEHLRHELIPANKHGH